MVVQALVQLTGSTYDVICTALELGGGALELEGGALMLEGGALELEGAALVVGRSVVLLDGAG